MKTYIYILILLMAFTMAWWLIPAAFAIWLIVKFFKISKPKDKESFGKTETIHL